MQGVVDYSGFWLAAAEIMRDIQEEVDRTAAAHETKAEMKAVAGLGLCGEAGEVADRIKKELFHGHPAEPEKIKEELGDLLWYAFAVAQAYGFTIDEAIRGNIEKLRKRYPEGFSREASLARIDQQ